MDKQKVIILIMNNDEGLTHTQIRKIAWDLSNPSIPFNATENRGYYNSPFSHYSDGWVTRLCSRNQVTKLYTLNPLGMEKLKSYFG